MNQIKECGILIKTLKPNVKVSFECKSGLLSAEPMLFENKGLNVFTVKTSKPANNVDFLLKAENECFLCHVDRIVVKFDDNVLTGTGDMVYVNQEKKEDIDEYISW